MAMAAELRTRTRRGWLIVAAAVVLGLLLLSAYRLGESRAQRHDRVLEGTFHVGTDVASARVDGRGYGFVPSAVIWYDADGANEGSKAPCLRHIGTAHLRFGTTDADLPDGGRYRPVTWVRCLP